MRPEKIIQTLTGLAILFFAGTLIVWLFQFIGITVNPAVLITSNPLGILAILGILVFVGFYMLHGGFEIIKSTFRD